MEDARSFLDLNRSQPPLFRPTEARLPGQLFCLAQASQNATATEVPGVDINIIINGGNATVGESLAATLERELATRYFTSALCSWHAAGCLIPPHE